MQILAFLPPREKGGNVLVVYVACNLRRHVTHYLSKEMTVDMKFGHVCVEELKEMKM
jgi:hypothetical protein